MNGGDTNLSGPQVAPNSPTPPAPGPQPASSAGSRPVDSSPILSIPHSDKAPSKPLVIKVQAPTPQPDTPSPTPSVAASPAPSPSPSVPTPDTQVDHTPTASAAPQPITPTPAPTTISTETFSAPTPVATGTYYGANTGMPAQNYPSGYTNPATSPTMQTYVSQYPTSTDTYAQDDQEFIELAGSTPQPKKSKKWIIIGVVAVVLVGTATLFAVLFSINSSSESQNSAQFSTKKEVYNALWDFNNKYYISLIEGYDFSIGLIPDFKMSSSDILFPAESYANILSQGVNDAESTYNNILPTLPNKIASDNIDLSQVKTSIGESLQALKQNSDLISEFYDTYIAPLISDSRPRTCSKTSAMTTLEQGRTANAASKYYTVYCDALNFINTTSDALVEPAVLDLQQQVATPASDAATALNDLLVDVPSATDSINQLFKELTK